MVDRISRLSDEVLCHILSFLPTQEAAATSVLSKRWKPLWISVPVLDYNDQIYLRNNKPYSLFEKFVYATILARDEHQPITSFTLQFWASDSGLSDATADAIHDRRLNAHANVWVNTAMQRGIENLDIEIWPENHFISLSPCIFSCRTLVVLKLKGLSLNASSSVELPSLKTLHLVAVHFVEPKYLMEVLYGSPMLEDLKLLNINYDLDEYDCKEEFKFKSLPKLVKADLRYVWMDDTNILLKTICNVKYLRLKQFQLVDEVPEFPHLRHLGLTLDNHSWHSVLLMLKNCPNLQSFKLDLSGSPEAEDVLLPDPHLVVPECLTSHFTKCYLKYFSGTKSDLKFAKYIMQNSTSLQSMAICKVSGDPLTQLKMVKELALCPRRSTSCELSFD